MPKKVIFRALICATALGLAVTSFGAGITLTITPSIGPNGNGSPSSPAYNLNATYALQNNLTSYDATPGGNTSNDPAAYQAAPAAVYVGDNIVTGFSSWQGVVNPAAPFNTELGNAVYFGLVAKGDGSTQFALDSLQGVMTSSDHSLDFPFDLSTLNYSTHTVGVIFGQNGNPDTFITSGAGTTLVDEIIYRGVANGWVPNGSTQADVNTLVALEMGASETMTYSITVGGHTFTASDTVIFIPEPNSLALFASAGVAGLLAMRSRRRKAGR